MMKTLSAALVCVVLIAAPAIAQNSNNKGQQSQASNSNQKEQNASTTGLWQGSKLIGLNVYNSANDKVGDIKQLMVSKSGKVDTVVIGVGGFLGMGERDVAVKFGELKWSEQPVRTNTSSTNKPTNSATTGAASDANSNTTSPARTYPDHALWNVNKNQVQKMEQFNYDK
jgi:hypothetical protein